MASLRVWRGAQMAFRGSSVLRGGRRVTPAITECCGAVLCYSTKDTDKAFAIGDYPVLPWRSAQLEKPSGWWDNQDRRDKETPLHEEDEALNMWMYDEVENNGKYTKWQALAQFVTAFALLGGVYYLSALYDAPSRNPAVPRQFPYDNLYLERGGDPGKPPGPENQKDKVRASYGELFS